jgi:glutathione synthase/RimK-type ligase-like ATP-grasp enzyme
VIDCTLVTCDDVTHLDPDDRLLVTELVKRGFSVAAAVWSDPTVNWSASKICILRSTWDYHSRFEEFAAWIDRVSGLTTVWNPPELVRWNADKGYLRDLESAGVRTVPTVWATRGENFLLDQCCEQYGFCDIVIKPARGAATHDVLLIRGDRDSLARGQVHLDRLLQEHDALVQPYLESVMSYGERALIFIENFHSHTVVKKPFDKVLAVRANITPVVEAAADEIDLAINALRRVPVRPMYARVDLLRDSNGESRISEVELIEPGLYFGACPEAVTLFADALERQIEECSPPMGATLGRPSGR